MAFWSSQTLEERADDLIIGGEGKLAVDCNSLRLCVGDEIFVTPQLADVNTVTKRRLVKGESFTIPPQQFAFILTEERVSIPIDAMAFISMRATFKMLGLVNVSGFHVDPGWDGKLIFAVFNSGPSPVILERGQQVFLMWCADLDKPSEKHTTKPGKNTIEPERLAALTAPTDSLYQLNKRLLEESDSRKIATDDMRERLHDVEKTMVAMKVRNAIALTILVATMIFFFRTELLGIVAKMGDNTETPIDSSPNTDP
jgi:dCTP deaminase